MKEWWTHLSLREKQTVSIGGMLVSLFLLYAILWAPLSNKVENLRHQIQKNQTLLAWMQESDQRIQKLEKNQQAHTAQSAASLLNIIQTDINNTTLGKNVTVLQQADNQAVQIHLQNVDFDNLMKWLIKLTLQQSLVIDQLTITPTTNPGSVDADLKITI